MKKIITTLVFFGLCVMVSAQDFSNNFLEANKDKQADFTIVNVTPSMLKMIVDQMGSEADAEMKTFIQNIKGFRMVTAANNSKNHYNSAKSSLSGQYEELVSVDNSAKNVRIYTKDAKNNVASEVIMLMLENTKFTLIDISGKIDLNQLSKLSTIVSKM